MKFMRKKVRDDKYDDGFYDPDYYQQKDDASFDDEDVSEYTAAEDPVAQTSAAGGVAFGGNNSGVALKVVKPTGYNDGPEIADYLAGGSTVLLNVENLELSATKRLLDFLLGAIHVLGGSMKMVANGTFVFAPRNVGVSEIDGENGTEEASDAE